MKPTIGLYIHIPFCEKMCHYCNFLTFVRREGTINQYAEYLIKEIELYKEKDYQVDTIYFGGGTPSYIDESWIAKIMEAVYENFIVLDDCEISIEMNPESVTLEKLRAYLAAGINRFSMGVQSFNDDVLKLMGRLHNRKTVFDKVELMRQAGCHNFGIDLMFANPKQDFSILEEDLYQATQLDVNHISYYSLMIKDDTPFKRWVETGQIKLITDEEEREMYHFIQTELRQHGFNQYEISNFARDGKVSRHNQKYWRLDDYLGLGLGASSNIGLKRFDNERKFEDYFQKIDRYEYPIEFVEDLDLEQREKEFIMLNMRLLKGFSIEEINQKFNIDFLTKYKKAIDKHLNYGTVMVDDQRFAFTDYGLDIGNQFYLEIL